MKNPYGVELTRYMNKKNSEGAIICDSDCGPLFSYDIYIDDNVIERLTALFIIIVFLDMNVILNIRYHYL